MAYASIGHFHAQNVIISVFERRVELTRALLENTQYYIGDIMPL